MPLRALLLLLLMLTGGCPRKLAPPATEQSGGEALANLSRTAAAYRALAAALAESGWLPLPAQADELEQARAALALSGARWVNSSASNGSAVWQLGSAITVLCTPEGGVQRIMLLPDAASLAPQELGRAARACAALSRSQQQPATDLTAPGAELQPGGFYFEYDYACRVWRFEPQFSGERCTRIDVLAQPGS